MPRAFVIMPFAADFSDIYAGLIKSTLEAAGYEVFRADDLEHQHAILRDIVTGLATADLIVADLTDSNPNVYYELGIAHGLQRPVILLTQAVDELPFDLRAYRVIPYSTHFARINEARSKLEHTARGAREGGISFGNPVSDFVPPPSLEPSPEPPSGPAPSPSEVEDGEKGLLDHFIQLNDAMQTLTNLLNTNNQSTAQIGLDTQAAGQLLQGTIESVSADSLRNQREIVARLGESLQAYADGLESRNEQYTQALEGVRESLEAILGYNQATTPEGNAKREEFRKTLSSSLESIKGAFQATQNLIETIGTAPSMEKRFNRAKQAAVRALRRYADNMELTMAVFRRALELGESQSNTP